MPRETIPIRFDAEKRHEVDSVVDAAGSGWSFLSNGTPDADLAVRRRQVERILEGLRQADAGQFASDDEVEAAYALWQAISPTSGA